MSKKYKNDIKLIKKNNNFFKRFCIFLLSVIVLTCLFFSGMLIANLLTNNNLNLFNNKISIKSINYYAIHFGEFDTEEEALNCSIWTASSGGSAYVFNNGKYMVIGQLYRNIDDANIVLSNLNADLTYVPNIAQYKTKKLQLNINNLSNGDKKDINNDIKLIFNTINNMLKISNNLDKNLISNVSASSEVNTLKSKLKVAKVEVESINVNYNSEDLDKLKNFMISVEDCLDVCTIKLLSGENYNSVCKYCACELFFNYYEFAENFDK